MLLGECYKIISIYISNFHNMNGIFLSIALTAKLNRDKNCINRNKKSTIINEDKIDFFK